MERKQGVNKRASAQELDRLGALFPTVERAELQAVFDLIPQLKVNSLAPGAAMPVPRLLSPDFHLVTWRGLHVSIPYRVYFQEPVLAAEQRLTSRQRQLLGCLYLRHHDGFVRQRYLVELLTSAEMEDFAVPSTFSLVSDYVQEILVVVATHLTPSLLASYVELIRENPRYWSQTQGRVASYWDVYYRAGRRGTSQFRHYVGRHLLGRLRQAVRLAAST